MDKIIENVKFKSDINDDMKHVRRISFDINVEELRKLKEASSTMNYYWT